MKSILLTLLLCLSAVNTYASLLVSPSRVAFDERERTQEVILVNTTTQTRSYKLEWVRQAQAQSGGYVPLSDIEQESFALADPFLRFSPRRVTLQPGESQTVKVMARRRGNMDRPEYRSHLKFTALPFDLTNQIDDAPAEGVSMKLHLLLSYTIPVILRTQAPSNQVSIANSRYVEEESGKQLIKFSLNKNSATSIYGDFTVYHELNGQSNAVAFLNGVNFFHEIDSMEVVIPVHHRLTTRQGNLKIVYKGSTEFADIILDENSISL